MVAWIRALQHDADTHITDAVHNEALAWALGLYIVNCSSMAARAWLVWDMVVTFQDEVEIVWQMKWSFIKFLYFFIRYIGICLQAMPTSSSLWSIGSTQNSKINIGEHGCWAWHVYQAMVVCFHTVAIDYILLLRVYALYSRHRLLRRMLRSLFFVVAVAMFVSFAAFMPRFKYDTTCSLAMPTHKGIYIYGAASTIFQLTLFFLTLGKFVQAVKAGWSTTPIITLLMRDGTWSFFVVVALTLMYLLVLTSAHPSFSNLLFNWGISIYSFVGYRNLLNIFKLSVQSRAVPTRPSALLSTNMITAQDPLTLEEYERQMGLMARND